jgi:predicted nuclease with TOPRIM domain
MSKTNVDDLLIEMITPKVKEIEERFSRGEGLSNEDINTLLLKSQYNHINHLDGRLDEVTASVRALEGKFQGLEGKFQGLEGKFDVLKAEINGRLDAFEKTVELKIAQAINTNMRWSIGMIALIVTVLKLADMFIK